MKMKINSKRFLTISITSYWSSNLLKHLGPLLWIQGEKDHLLLATSCIMISSKEVEGYIAIWKIQDSARAISGFDAPFLL